MALHRLPPDVRVGVCRRTSTASRSSGAVAMITCVGSCDKVETSYIEDEAMVCAKLCRTVGVHLVPLPELDSSFARACGVVVCV